MPSAPGVLHQRWFQVLFFGLVTFFALTQVARSTENPIFYPSIIALGAFLVPVAFVTWIYSRTRAFEVVLTTVAICFLWGGLTGTTLAGLIEYETLRGLGPLALLGVGVIEEASKLIAPAVIYVRGRYLREAEGILFGVASGMGFAAFETMGYGFVALIQSQGSITDLELVLFVRGLLSPAGHAAWTGLVCAVLWRERARRHNPWPNWRVLAAFLTASLLHMLWDFFNLLSGPTLISASGIELLSLAVAAFSFALLLRRINEADREPGGPPGEGPTSSSGQRAESRKSSTPAV